MAQHELRGNWESANLETASSGEIADVMVARIQVFVENMEGREIVRPEEFYQVMEVAFGRKAADTYMFHIISLANGLIKMEQFRRAAIERER